MIDLDEYDQADSYCEVCDKPEWHDGLPLGECATCERIVCGRCHVGGDDVVDACKGCR